MNYIDLYRLYFVFLWILEHVESSEKKLFKNLTDNYRMMGKHGRPVMDPKDVVVVNFSLSLVQLLEVDEKSQTIKTIAWISYGWKDEYLTWNEEEFGGVDSIIFPDHYIWKPSVACYTKSDKAKNLMDGEHAEVTVFPDGTVSTVVPYLLVTSCSIELTYFPVDEQTCHFKFLSWTGDDTKQLLEFFGTPEVDLTDYTDSSEWELRPLNATKYNKTFGGSLPFTGLQYSIKLKRNPTFYDLVIVKPAIMLGVMTIFTFLIPPSAADRYAYGAGLFAAVFFLLIIVADVTPHGTDPGRRPLIGIYLYLNMVLVVFAMAISAVVIWIYDHTNQNGETKSDVIYPEKNADSNGQKDENTDIRKSNPRIFRMKKLKTWAKKMPVIIDRVAIVLFIALEITYYYVFIPR